jgi:nucleoside-diphosphate-sugar epimerase
VSAPASETFLVTGSEGCLGAWVVKDLVDEGHACIALDLSAEGRRIRTLVGDEGLERVVPVEGDIVSEGLVRSLVEERGVTRIVHLAALQIPLVAADPVRGAIVNVAGTVQVFEAVRAAREQVRGLAYASSAASSAQSEANGDPKRSKASSRSRTKSARASTSRTTASRASACAPGRSSVSGAIRA